ncbi:hypothetical protein DdX_16664 [Ditylenchus destructor]|uniref:Uncharacterized protein n=1 Tax=Ditylenchus destructor TaxID=166010 RepID=A0AAD4MT66_9BILA|nr:hypothetical protein DdX_16664 [Ditylenchus destructor]
MDPSERRMLLEELQELEHQAEELPKLLVWSIERIARLKSRMGDPEDDVVKAIPPKFAQRLASAKQGNGSPTVPHAAAVPPPANVQPPATQAQVSSNSSLFFTANTYVQEAGPNSKKARTVLQNADKPESFPATGGSVHQGKNFAANLAQDQANAMASGLRVGPSDLHPRGIPQYVPGDPNPWPAFNGYPNHIFEGCKTDNDKRRAKEKFQQWNPHLFPHRTAIAKRIAKISAQEDAGTLEDGGPERARLDWLRSLSASGGKANAQEPTMLDRIIDYVRNIESSGTQQDIGDNLQDVQDPEIEQAVSNIPIPQSEPTFQNAPNFQQIGPTQPQTDLNMQNLAKSRLVINFQRPTDPADKKLTF